MKLSIIVTYYQGRNILVTALKLLLSTLYSVKNYEILVANDNPNENIETVTCHISDKIRVINMKSNMGYAGACNETVSHATGDLILFVDCDIMVTPNWIQPLLEVLEKEPRAGSISSTILNMDTGGVVHWGMAMHGVELLKPFRNCPLPKQFRTGYRPFSLVTSGCLMIRREVFEKVGGMGVEFYNGYCDLDLALKINGLGLLNYASSDSVVYHRGKVAGSIRLISSQDTRALFIKKWTNKLPDDALPLLEELYDSGINKKLHAQCALINFSKSLYVNDYTSVLRKSLSCRFTNNYRFRHSGTPIILEDFLPWDLCASQYPLIYFLDDINLAKNNHHWFFHRKGKQDIMADRQGNVLTIDSLQD